MRGMVSWFARNGVAANLVMFIIIVGGLLTLPGIKKEIFPEYSVDIVTVTVEYRGAAPQEVEEGICVRIEEAIQGLDGIKKLSSRASEGSGTVTVEVMAGFDTREVLDDVKSRVDAIDTFPEEAEKPVIRELTNRFQVINVSISGDADELTLKRLGKQVRDDLTSLPEISQAELKNARAYEVSIEISEDALRRHGLTFDQVADAVRRSSLDLPGGSVKTETGEILLRTKGQAYRGHEFENLTLLTKPDGTKLLLKDVATVIDGFEDTDQWARLDAKPTVMVQVFRVGDQNALEVSEAVYRYIDQNAGRLPEGIALTTWQDNAEYLRGRMDLLIRNAISGLALVFLVLALFLRLRLAFWVSIGIPISFLGAIAMMPIVDVSVNMISLFSFILVLGIVVDDAIVVGENIFKKQEETGEGLRASIAGANEVTVPVIFGVLTTVAAFAPMLFVPGYNGKIWRVIPLIVIPTLLFSLVESKLVLPSHLSHFRRKPKPAKRHLLVRMWDGFFRFFGDGLQWFIQRVYRPSLRLALEWRYLTVAVAAMTLLLTTGLVGGGIVKFVFLPEVESDYVVATIVLPQETPATVTARAVQQLEESALRLEKELEQGTGEAVFRHVLTSVGEQPFKTIQSRNQGDMGSNFVGANIGEVDIELVPSQDRAMSSTEIAARWRELNGPIPGAVELSFTADLIGGSPDIDIQLVGHDFATLSEVADQVKAQLAEYPGAIDITDSFRGGKPEVKLAINPKAEALGLSLSDLARQVRQGFYGEEAQRIQRGRDDVRVMVRYPERERRSLGHLETMRIRTPSGAEVPFSTVATAELDRGFSTITRVDRRRTVNVTAGVDDTQGNANEILADLDRQFLPSLLADYPGVSYTFEGQQRDQAEALSGLFRGFIVALFVIYALMAIPFKSYVQPLIVMSAVPFGIVGAVWGHALLGMSLSILSLCGLVALTGIVVNDSLVLVNFVNRLRAAGVPLRQAVHDAGLARFRAILLTSLTTAAGITPLMLEKSVQARFLIPMAVALVFGVLFATFITLVLVPAGYLILEDFRRLSRWMLGLSSPAAGQTVEEAPELVPDAGFETNGANRQPAPAPEVSSASLFEATLEPEEPAAPRRGRTERD